MARPPKVQFRLILAGGRSTAMKDADTHLDREVDALFARELGRVINKDSEKRLLPKRMIGRLESALTRVYMGALTEAINSWIGSPRQTHSLQGREMLTTNSEILKGLSKNIDPKKSPRFAAMLRTELGRGTKVVWRKLKTTTLEKKYKVFRNKDGKRNLRKSKNTSNAFFYYTGALKSELTAKKRQMVKATGIIRVTGIEIRKKGRFQSLRDFRGSVPVGKLRFRLLPNVGGSLPGLRTGNWTQDSRNMNFERKLGLSEESIDKLGLLNLDYNMKNASREDLEKRPLLQPVFTYITLFRAPVIVAGSVNKAVREFNRQYGSTDNYGL